MPARRTSAPSSASRPDASDAYTAQDIEVLEGLEPVRRRPGMYVGGADERAAHHLFAEVLDNAMDEAVAGHADLIEVRLEADGAVVVTDNGRGIPVDPHPKFPDKSALEVILTTLHAGGKFSQNAYETSGGLNGVGISVVNALSSALSVEVARGRVLFRQEFAEGVPLAPLKKVGAAPNRRGTSVRFVPDPKIFKSHATLKAARLFAMCKAKAYLRRGVTIRWQAAQEALTGDDTPTQAELHFPGGLSDYLTELMAARRTLTSVAFCGRAERDGGPGGVEWAVAWTPDGFGEADGFTRSYCNTIPTPAGGTHEQGLRMALVRGLRAYGELKGEKKAALVTADDVMGTAGALVSVFVSNPEFQGQTKDKLTSADAARLVETTMRDPFDHWLAGAPKEADKLLAWVVERAEERLRRRKEREVQRKTATRRLRLPGKLSDCARSGADGTELFLVEGDSAGGTAKQARNRDTQAVLPLRGKILNVASAAPDKIQKNQEIADLALALGVQLGQRFNLDDLRYERIIIMTDADVDGAHIAALLITFFQRATPGLVEAGRLFLALPPLYRLAQGAKSAYARDDAHKDHLLATFFTGAAKVEIGRFKGLGEMMPKQLKDTTMHPGTRTLARVVPPADGGDVRELVEALMGRKPELRFQFIQENAHFAAADVDV